MARVLTGLLSFLVVGLLLACAQTKSPNSPSRPRRVSAEKRKEIVVRAGGNLQAAINAAKFGDTIILEAGAIYQTGGAPYFSPFSLGAKSGGTGTDADFITIRSSNIASLPAGRVSAQDKVNMPKIVALGNPGALTFTENARYWKLEGLEITNTSDGTPPRHANTLVPIGGAPGIAHIWIDKCYIHSQEDGTNKFGRTASHGVVVSSPATGANVYDTRITNSHISGFGGAYAHDTTQLIDAEALGSSVLDTILLHNNFLSATYQPWFPSGADPVNPEKAVVQASPAPTLTTARLSNITGLNVGDYMTFPQSVPSPRNNGNARITQIEGNDVTFTSMTRFVGGAPEPPVVGSTVMWGGEVGRNYTVTHNTFDIDTALAQAAYAATRSNPKGYIEMKMGVNVRIEGNIFQGWPSTIAIQAVNQNGDTPWVTVSDFTFRNNWVKDFGTAFIINMGNPTGPDWHKSRLGENLIIENNLFANTAASTIMTAIYLGPNARISHNTWITNPTHDGYMVVIVTGGGGTGMQIRDNIFQYSRSGWICTGGLPACFPGFPNKVESKNAIINNLGLVSDADIQSVWTRSYVASKGKNRVTFTGSNPDVLMDWKLAPGSPYQAGGPRQASDGTDVGVNIEALAIALAAQKGQAVTRSSPTVGP